MRRPIIQWLTTTVSLFTLAAALLAGCARTARVPTAPETAQPAVAVRANATAIAQAMAVQERASDVLLARPEVVGTATALGRDGRPVVRIYTQRPGVRGLPTTLEGVPVEVEVSGPLVAFGLTERYRPVPVGVSVGNANECIPGTIGAVLIRDGVRYLLSANHVFARQNQATIGELIVQPSRPDASPSCDPSAASTRVARLSDFEPLRFDGSPNTIDAAIALVTADESSCATLPMFYGAPGPPLEATLGLPVQKVGRTTGLTQGTVTAINAQVVIFYAAGKAKFTGQIMTSKAFGQFGDSGSLVVTSDQNRNAVGMVFAGGDNGSAVVNPIGPVLARFGATLCGP